MKTIIPGPKLLFRLLLFGISLELTYAASCYSHKDCRTCTRSSSWFSNCRWCPLGHTCHAHGSLYNACTSQQTVYSPTKCFDMNKGKYDPGEAYISTLLSAAAYNNRPQKCTQKFSPTADYKVVQRIGHACVDAPLFKYTNCFAYTAVSTKRRNIVMAFRGSVNGKQVIDQMMSVLFKPKVKFMIGGHVQQYFVGAFDNLSPCLEKSIRKLLRRYQGYSVTVTGHSLGGAVASLAAASLVHKKIVSADKLTLYTFGQPRVGDKNFAYYHDRLIKSSWRVVHFLDIVTNLPTCTPIIGCTLEAGTAPYHHGIEIFYPANEMKVASKYIQCNGDESMKCSNGYIHRCTFKMMQCIEDHKSYFGIQMGSACPASSSTLRFVPRRDDVSDDDHVLERRLFSNDFCSVIDTSGED